MASESLSRGAPLKAFSRRRRKAADSPGEPAPPVAACLRSCDAARGRLERGSEPGQMTSNPPMAPARANSVKMAIVGTLLVALAVEASASHQQWVLAEIAGAAGV